MIIFRETKTFTEYLQKLKAIITHNKTQRTLMDMSIRQHELGDDNGAIKSANSISFVNDVYAIALHDKSIGIMTTSAPDLDQSDKTKYRIVSKEDVKYIAPSLQHVIGDNETIAIEDPQDLNTAPGLSRITI